MRQQLDQLGISDNTAVLHIRPNNAFVDWLAEVIPEEIALTKHELENYITQEVWDNHSLTFLVPRFGSTDEFDQFIEQHYTAIIDLLLYAWPVPLKAWPSPDNSDTLFELFDLVYYGYFIDVDYQNAAQRPRDMDCSISLITPTDEFALWLKQLEQSNQYRRPYRDFFGDELFYKTGVSVIAPVFDKQQKPEEFIKDHYRTLFGHLLAKYTVNTAYWPKEWDHDLFSRWFEYRNFFPLISLLPAHDSSYKKAA